jgi:hypothetical protein
MAARNGADTPVLEWRGRLICSGSGSRQVDFLVTGTERRASARADQSDAENLGAGDPRGGLGQFRPEWTADLSAAPETVCAEISLR